MTILRPSKLLAAALSTGAVLLSASACANADSQSSDDGTLTIGYSGYSLTNPYFAGLIKGLKDGAAAHGWELVTTNSNGNNDTQVSDIQNLVTQGVDYLIVTPGDGKAVAPAIAEAKAADVPVIALADTIDSPDVLTTVSPNHESIGALGAQQLVDFLTKKYGQPKGNVVNIQGLAGTPATNYRQTGFESVISQYPGINVVATQDGGWDTDKTFQVMSTVLEANQDIDAVFTANDSMAQGATKAIEAAGLFKPVGDAGHIYVGGSDAPAPAIADIRAGRQDVSVSQQPIRMAEATLDYIAELENGGAEKAEIEWPAQVITQENIKSDEVAQYGIWADEL
jgi:ABC-type sugar transport system substrate-binding protein